MRLIFQGFVRSGAAVASLLFAATLGLAQVGAGGGAAGAGGATGGAGGVTGAAGGAGTGVTAPNVGGAAPGSVAPGGAAPGVQAPGVPGVAPGLPGAGVPGGTPGLPGVQNPGGTIAPGVQAPGLSGPGLNPSLPNSGPVTPGATSPASGNVSTPNSPAAPSGAAGGTGSPQAAPATPGFRSTGVGSTSTPGSGTASPNAATLPNGSAFPGSATGAANTALGGTPGTGATGTSGAPGTGLPGANTDATGAGSTGNSANPVNRGQLGFSVRSGAGDGLVVNNVNTGGLAQQAGLLSGDQIVSVNGSAVNSQADISTALRQSGLSGNNVKLGVMRNGQLQTINVNSGSGTNNLGQAGPNGSTSAGLTPTSTQVTTGFRGFGDGLTFGTSQSGLSISGMTDGSWASSAGFQTGDQIVSVDGQPVATQTQFPTQLQGAIDRNGFANVIVNRNGQTVPLRVTMPAGASGLSSSGQLGATGDFGSFAGDFSTAFTGANTSLQAQMTQLNSLNDRVTALRTALANPPTDAAGRAQVLDQLRALRADFNTLNNQSNTQFFQQLEALRTRLNDFNPTFNQGTSATGSGSGAAGGGSAFSSGTTSGSASGAASSSSSPAVPGAVSGRSTTLSGGASGTAADRTIIGGPSSDSRPSGVTAPPITRP